MPNKVEKPEELKLIEDDVYNKDRPTHTVVFRVNWNY
jgi:hypothetical protein